MDNGLELGGLDPSDLPDENGDSGTGPLPVADMDSDKGLDLSGLCEDCPGEGLDLSGLCGDDDEDPPPKLAIDIPPAAAADTKAFPAPVFVPDGFHADNAPPPCAQSPSFGFIVTETEEVAPGPHVACMTAHPDADTAPGLQEAMLELVRAMYAGMHSQYQPPQRVDPLLTPLGKAMNQLSCAVPAPPHEPAVAATRTESSSPTKKTKGAVSRQKHESSTRPDGPEPVLDLIEEDTEPPSDTIEGWLMCLGRCHTNVQGRNLYRAPCRRAPAGGASTLRALANELLDGIEAIEIRLENTPVPAKKRAPKSVRGASSRKKARPNKPRARTEASDDSGGGGDDNNNNEDAEEEDEDEDGSDDADRRPHGQSRRVVSEEIKAPKRREAITSALGSVLRGALRRVNELCLHDREASTVTCNCRSYDETLRRETADTLVPAACPRKRERGPKSGTGMAANPICNPHAKFHALIRSSVCDILLTFRLALGHGTSSLRELTRDLLCHMLDWFAFRCVYSNQNLSFRNVDSFTRVALRRILSSADPAHVQHMQTSLSTATRITCNPL